MKHTAHPCGCKKDIGMSKAHIPQSCEEHGNLFVYDHGLGSAAPSDGGGRRRRNSSLKPGKGFAASDAQRAKVEGLVCVGCGLEGSEDGRLIIDPAHLWPRGRGGCDDEDCVLPLCRFGADGSGCHRLFDEGGLDLLARISERDMHEAYAKELAHPIAVHGVSLISLITRLSGSEWEFRRKADLDLERLARELHQKDWPSIDWLSGAAEPTRDAYRQKALEAVGTVAADVA